MIVRLIGWNGSKLLVPWQIILMSFLYGFSGWRSAIIAEQYGVINQSGSNVWDALFITFSGPPFGSLSPFDLIRLLLLYAVYLLFVADPYGEKGRNDQYSLLRAGSRITWWYGKVGTLLFSSIFYIAVCIVAVLVGGGFQLPILFQTSELMTSGYLWPFTRVPDIDQLLMDIILINATTLYVQSVIQSFLTMIFRSSVYAWIITILLIVISFMVGTMSPGLNQWLPGTQSILIRHSMYDPTTGGFTLAWTVSYNILLSVGIIFAGAWYANRTDIWS